MSILSFLNDLGIIPNEGTGLENNSNLLQGQKFMEYSRVYQKSIEPHLIKLQMTSLPNVESIIEGMHQDNSVKSLMVTSKSEMSTNEKDFNKTMIEYSSIYKQISEEPLHPHIRHNKELNLKLLKRLSELNKKLIYLSEQIVKDVERTAKSHSKNIRKHNIHDLHKKIYEKKKIFNEYVHKLKQEQKTFNKDYMDTLSGQDESSTYNVVSNIYKLFLLIIVLFIIFFIFININTSDLSTTHIILIVLIVLLGGLYLKNL